MWSRMRACMDGEGRVPPLTLLRANCQTSTQLLSALVPTRATSRCDGTMGMSETPMRPQSHCTSCARRTFACDTVAMYTMRTTPLMWSFRATISACKSSQSCPMSVSNAMLTRECGGAPRRIAAAPGDAVVPLDESAPSAVL